MMARRRVLYTSRRKPLIIFLQVDVCRLVCLI